jgi:ATP-dependent Lhr-like helicase
MRQVVQRGSATLAEGKEGTAPRSALEQELARRLGPRQQRSPGLRRPSPARYRAASRRARQRVEDKAAPAWMGRWSAVRRFGVMGKAPAPGQCAQGRARQLLQRYGVVSYESLKQEETGWGWSEIYRQLQRLEMRGEVRRGLFVQGLPGIQFALPEAAEDLRGLRDAADDNMIVLNACDPANLHGSVSEYRPAGEGDETPRFARLPSNWLVQHRGLPLLVAEGTGNSLSTQPGAAEGLVRAALQAVLDHLGRFEHRITVERWNGTPVLDSPGQALLESVGFYRDALVMSWDRP